MAKTLGGSTFVYNGISQDYSFLETLESLHELCDQVSVAFGGDDGTAEKITAWHDSKNSGKIIMSYIAKEHWEEKKGREKLSYFSNIAISKLTTDWNFYLQADEILHERSFENVRDAIEFDVESYLCKRYNMWQDPVSHLVVEEARKPCSDVVIRLAKSKYGCFGDGESLMAPSTNKYHLVDFPDEQAFEIYHVGFIRDPVKQVVKSRNMLVDIFGLGWDERIGEKFDSKNFPFQGNDIQPVPLPVPKFVKQWLMIRHPDFAEQLSEHVEGRGHQSNGDATSNTDAPQ